MPQTVAHRLTLLENLIRHWTAKEAEFVESGNRNAERIARKVVRDFEKERRKLLGLRK